MPFVPLEVRRAHEAAEGRTLLPTGNGEVDGGVVIARLRRVGGPRFSAVPPPEGGGDRAPGSGGTLPPHPPPASAADHLPARSRRGAGAT
jgi:hypothetical protein